MGASQEESRKEIEIYCCSKTGERFSVVPVGEKAGKIRFMNLKHEIGLKPKPNGSDLIQLGKCPFCEAPLVSEWMLPILRAEK